MRIEWWETRDGRRAWVVDLPSFDGWCQGQIKTAGCIVAGTSHSWKKHGSECWRSAEAHALDLVTPLPDCDGWDWVKPKRWRLATEADVGREVRVSCVNTHTAISATSTRLLLAVCDGHFVCRTNSKYNEKPIVWRYAVIEE